LKLLLVLSEIENFFCNNTIKKTQSRPFD